MVFHSMTGGYFKENTNRQINTIKQGEQLMFSLFFVILFKKNYLYGEGEKSLLNFKNCYAIINRYKEGANVIWLKEVDFCEFLI